MVQWYWHDGSRQHGPCTVPELRALAAEGTLGGDTLVWREGLPEWQAAAAIPGLLIKQDAVAARRPAPSPPAGFPQGDPQGDPARFAPGPRIATQPAAEAPNAPPLPRPMQFATEQAAHLLADLRALDFREEVIPLDETNLRALTRSYVFWSASLLGVVPLLIGTFQDPNQQLTAFALFFAVLWGVIFKSFIVPVPRHWPKLAASLFFTGIAGIFSLLFIYEKFLPESYLSLVNSKSPTVRLLGYVFQVGFWEELTKSVPVLFYVWSRRSAANPMLAVLIGVFSGLGFAAFENMQYGERSVAQSALLTMQFGAKGAQAATTFAMSNVMLRSLSLVFVHAVLSGIVAYFLAMAARTGRRWAALFLVGLATAAVLHGLYDWLLGIQPTFAACIVVMSFMLFFAYTTKLKKLTETPVLVPADLSGPAPENR
jgi:RsiW-degrading membrane proteinase PrsW (M82 family)